MPIEAAKQPGARLLLTDDQISIEPSDGIGVLRVARRRIS